MYNIDADILEQNNAYTEKVDDDIYTHLNIRYHWLN